MTAADKEARVEKLFLKGFICEHEAKAMRESDWPNEPIDECLLCHADPTIEARNETCS